MSGFGAWVVLLSVVGYALPAVGQPGRRITSEDVAWYYARARFVKEFDSLRAHSSVLDMVAAPDHAPVQSDTLLEYIYRLMGSPLPEPYEQTWKGQVHSWRVVAPHERLRLKPFFRQTHMAYLGNDRYTALDTTATPMLRAKMQGAFGPPTETIVEAGRLGPPQEYIQFEYWFVVNDSIPIIVMDAGGPFDHGLLVAGDYRFRDQLYAVRQSLLGRNLREASPAAFVDYYYDTVALQWYRTGFDETEYYARSINRPTLSRGRPALSAPEQE